MKTAFAKGIVILGLFAGRSALSQHPAMPPGVTHEQHLALQELADTKTRGAVAMGFDQDKTTHHFLLTADGGTIQGNVNDPSDKANLELIRRHIREIAIEFAKGNFEKPMMTHGEIPLGVPAMKRLKGAIVYEFKEMSDGALVRISTSNAEAIEAIHLFLRYQIQEHATGDPFTIPR